MTIRNMVMVAGLAAVASGCVVAPGHYEERRVVTTHRVVYHENDSYQGYYYARVVYINGDPWYVDEYRRARPIPRHLHAHFRNSSWARSLPPRFSQDTVVRDGYPLSRIVYINDAPHHIDDDRRARPVPSKLRSRFSYVTVVHDNDRGRKPGERVELPVQVRERERVELPVQVRERERVELPVQVRERERVELPVHVREREREEQPAYVRAREEPPAHIGERERRGPVSGPESMPRPVVVQERVREERGPQDSPLFGNVRAAPPGQARAQQPERAQAGNGQRPLPQSAAQNRGDDERAGAGRGALPAAGETARGRIQTVSDVRQDPKGAAAGNEKRADSAAEKQKAKGRGKNRDEEEDEDEPEPGKKPRGR